MDFRYLYNKLPVASQIKMTFTVAVVLICSIQLIITAVLLTWMQNEMKSNSMDTLRSDCVFHMQTLAQAEALYLGQVIGDYQKIVSLLKNLNEIVQGSSKLTPPLFAENLIPIRGDSVPSDFYTTTRTVYISNLNPLTQYGNEILTKCTQIDYVLPYLYDKSFISIYEGISINEILNFYPGGYNTASYTPVVREWYYGAVKDRNHTRISEPYQDAFSLEWLFTISQAFMNKDNAILGVVSIDVTLELITSIVSKIQVIETGFALLVSMTGMILSMPESWKTEISYRIYDELYTSISFSLWTAISRAPDGTVFDYKDINGTEYILLVNSIKPRDYGSKTSHYLLLFANKTEIYKPSTDLDENYSKMYKILFWGVLSIVICVLLCSFIMIYFESKRVRNKIKHIEKVFERIVERALFAKCIRGVSFKRIDENSRGIEELVEGVKVRVSRLRSREAAFANFKWNSTRPSDFLIYCRWENVIQPFNLMSDKKMKWECAFPFLKDVKD